MDYRRDKTEGEISSLYSIFKGEIASVKEYGAFVRMPGDKKKQGLIHKSQMSSTKIDNPEEMLSVGETVWCKVIAIDADGGKIGLSMKVVSQTTGKDLDPNHVQTSLDEQKRKTGHKKGHDVIELGAVFDTTCKKCGGKGHLAKDCFHIPGSKKYELLPEEDFASQLQAKGFGKGGSKQPAHGSEGFGHAAHGSEGFGHATEEQQLNAQNFGRINKEQSTCSKPLKSKKRKKEKHKKKKKHHSSSSDSDCESHHKKHKKNTKKRKSSHDSEDSDVPKHKKKKEKKKRHKVLD